MRPHASRSHAHGRGVRLQRGSGHHRARQHKQLFMGYTSLLDLSNHARAAAAIGDSATASNAIVEIEGRLRLPRRCIESELHGRKPVDALLREERQCAEAALDRVPLAPDVQLPMLDV